MTLKPWIFSRGLLFVILWNLMFLASQLTLSCGPSSRVSQNNGQVRWHSMTPTMSFDRYITLSGQSSRKEDTEKAVLELLEWRFCHTCVWGGLAECSASSPTLSCYNMFFLHLRFDDLFFSMDFLWFNLIQPYYLHNSIHLPFSADDPGVQGPFM